MQVELIFEEENNDGLGKTIRDINYQQIKNKEETNIQRNIIRHILVSHPEGITDLELESITGFKRSSITARRNEITGMVAVGYAKIIDKDKDRLNTLWSIDNK